MSVGAAAIPLNLCAWQRVAKKISIRAWGLSRQPEDATLQGARNIKESAAEDMQTVNQHVLVQAKPQ